MMLYLLVYLCPVVVQVTVPSLLRRGQKEQDLFLQLLSFLLRLLTEADPLLVPGVACKSVREVVFSRV